MLSKRQEVILRLIIEEYIKTAEPIGSRTLSKILEISSATIRNEMADLEELGYIEKTHTSSGRVPSDKGYHYYIETILQDGESFTQSFNAIDELFDNTNIKREEAIKQAMNLLSQLTNYTTIALGPSAYGSKVKKVELVPLSEDTCILLVITNQGHVESKQIIVPENTTLDDMKRVIEVLNDILYDCPINQVSEKLHYEMNAKKIEDILSYNQTIIDSFLEAFTKFTQSKFYLSGKNKVLYQPEFSDLTRVRELLTFFEQNDIFRLVENTKNEEMSVRIGKENQITAMRDCTVITVPYDLNDEESGTIAIVGPTRMEYQKVIPLVKYLASHMSKLYKRRK
ncbi:Heat-inducible transcription repressor HrcA [Candidatus Izimaplasma bacterium HR1]|jgi:heat-inducible transcriptional repressor|uniref:heat-inducible transcriptional repressor HrcA n=1 Tax=Candidatus Izimoplasma sp. HR1 TaxID=1541959 RepID=UPI0004F8AD4A|nr:Heat-inducible transcription repressor HrcA [Candidatus Izimaplasma bacterium HR1]